VRDERSTRGDSYWSKEFRYLWESIRDNDAYLSEAPCDWSAIPRAYAPELAKITDRSGFISLLERVLDELCDNHISLGTNLASSFRLVPSGTDVRVEARPDGVFVTDLRSGASPLSRGTRILGVGGKSLDVALKEVWPKTVPSNNLLAKTYFSNKLLAGRYNQLRTVRTTQGPLALLPMEHGSEKRPLLSVTVAGRIGRVQPLDSLGDNDLIAEFDRAMERVRGCSGLVLDLTETPSGGNTTVARAILGWFVQKETPYQRHEDPTELRRFGVRRFWTEWVAPRPGKRFNGRVCVLVNGWTGSMGEGIAIGLQGMGRAILIGSPLAGLKGAVSRDELPETKIPFVFPTEQIFRLDGTPREKCRPDILAAWGPDRPALRRAEAWLK
jgi:hypothetical protein